MYAGRALTAVATIGPYIDRVPGDVLAECSAPDSSTSRSKAICVVSPATDVKCDRGDRAAGEGHHAGSQARSRPAIPYPFPAESVAVNSLIAILPAVRG